MGFLLGGAPNKPNADQPPQYAGLQLQTSAMGVPVPILWGTQRVSGNLIWYSNFQAIPHVTTSDAGGGGGKGGDGSTATSSTSYTYQVAAALGLTEGPITASSNTAWSGKNVTTLSALGFTLKNGEYDGTQTPWSFLTTNYPAEALEYRGHAYVANSAIDLGNSASLPNLSFELVGRLPYDYDAIDNPQPDANMADVVEDWLTNANYGVLFPSANIDDLTNYSDYVRATGLLMSPLLKEQSEARQTLDLWMQVTNTGPVWSENLLKLIPYGDSTVSGNGVTYTPVVTAVADFTDDDYLPPSRDEDPVACVRKTTADAFNSVQVEYLDRSNAYNVAICEVKDQASIEANGLRPYKPISAHMITSIDVATTVAQLILQRVCYIRNTYKFKTSWVKGLLLEPMDIVTLTDSGLGLSVYPVRILSVDEANDEFTITAEEFPLGVASPASITSQSGSGAQLDYNVSPGSVMPPAFLEAPVSQASTGLAIGVAVTGNDPNWGGCSVYVSYDGDSYRLSGTVSGGSRYGTITANMSAAASQLANAALVGNGGTIVSGTTLDATNLATACCIADEYCAYTTSTMTSANHYSLTMLTRGAEGSVAAAHLSGVQFVRIDDTITWGDPLPLSRIGTQIYFKFPSFNLYGGGGQSLADVPAYSYTIRGAQALLPPSDVTGFSNSLDSVAGIKLSWTDITDGDRLDYEIRVGASWAAGVLVARLAATSLIIPPLAAGTYTYWIAARDQFLNYSTTPASTVATINAVGVPSVAAVVTGANYVLTWAAPTSAFAIDHYVVRYGADYASGTEVGQVKGTTLQAPVNFSGTRNFWVAAVDSAGNTSSAALATINIANPAAITATAQVVDNNVLLYWTAPVTGTLPILTYEIRSGATYGASTLVGTKAGLFTNLFETVAGTYTYWITAIDTGGNYGTPASVSATMSQPPDYVLLNDYNSAFGGTFSNAVLDAGAVVLPINTTETYGDHFTTGGWATPQDQIDAGYPIYIEPSQSTGYYEEIVDYGTVIASSKITLTPTYQTIAGTPGVDVTVSYSNDGITYTSPVSALTLFATSFQYVKFRFTVTSSGGDDLVSLSAFNVRLDVKEQSESSFLSCVSTDAGGTTYTFTKTWLDVNSITATAQGTNNYIVVVNFTDAPNPTSAKFLVFNAAGTRVSADIGLLIRGY